MSQLTTRASSPTAEPPATQSTGPLVLKDCLEDCLEKELEELKRCLILAADAGGVEEELLCRAKKGREQLQQVRMEALLQ